MTDWCFHAELFSVVQFWCNFFHFYLQELLEVGRGNLVVWQQPLATHGVTASTPGSYYSIMTCQQDRWELNNEENLNKATPVVLCQMDVSFSLCGYTTSAENLSLYCQLLIWGEGQSVSFAFQGWPVHLPVLGQAYLSHKTYGWPVGTGIQAQGCKFLELLVHFVLWRCMVILKVLSCAGILGRNRRLVLSLPQLFCCFLLFVPNSDCDC